MNTPADRSNRLPVLAAEIRKAHADVQDAAKTAAERAISAGHALIEAKSLLQHGQWLPWLREHCALTERTAQLYMKIAKSGATAETVAAIGLQGASQILTTIFDPYYDPWYQCDDDAKRDWHVWMLFLVSECGWYPEGAWAHTEWILQFGVPITPCEWLTGEKYILWRKSSRLRNQPPAFVKGWRSFLEAYRHRPITELEAELTRFHQERGPQPPTKLRCKRKSATVADLEGAT